VTSHRFPRSHPVVIVEIRDLFLESPFEGAKLDKVTINPPRNDKRRADPKISPWPRAYLWVEWIPPEGEECEADCAFEVQ
jgi:hypothetical protein